MKLLKMGSLALAIVLFVAGYALAKEKAVEEGEKSKAQTVCPVMGGKINKEIYADHDGKRVYFCCPMCIKKFKKDPEKYIKKLENQGITPEKTPKPQTTCPVMGGKINKKVYADHKGKRVYFCCPMCIEKFNKDPEKYIKKLEDQGIELDKTPGNNPKEKGHHKKSMKKKKGEHMGHDMNMNDKDCNCGSDCDCGHGMD